MKGNYNIINIEGQVKFLEWTLWFHTKFLSYHFGFCSVSQITFTQPLKSLYPTKQLNQSSSQKMNFKQPKWLGKWKNFNKTEISLFTFSRHSWN